MYCNHVGDNMMKACNSYTNYQEFLKNTKEHCGDCTQVPTSCQRCQLQMLEIEAQNALDIMWGDPEGHCGKNCITEYNGLDHSNK